MVKDGKSTGKIGGFALGQFRASRQQKEVGNGKNEEIAVGIPDSAFISCKREVRVII